MSLKAVGYRTNHGYMPVLEDKEIVYERHQLPSCWGSNTGISKATFKVVGNVCFLHLNLYIKEGTRSDASLNITVPDDLKPVEEAFVWINWGHGSFGEYGSNNGSQSIKIDTNGVINIGTAKNLTLNNLLPNVEIPENRFYLSTPVAGAWKINRKGVVL